MTRKKRPSITLRTLRFLRNLAAGDLGPLARVRRIAGNLARRGRPERAGCCGNYGEPGC
jgi:hypothetical protein